MITEAHYRHFQQRLTESKPFRYFWQFWSNYAAVFIGIAALVIFFEPEFNEVQKSILWLSAVSFVLARFVVVSVINFLSQRQRPYQKYNFSPITSKFFSFKTTIPNSFPSRHTTSFFSVAIVFAMFVPVIGIVLIFISALTGIARVILGYHWPSDILVGALIGLVVGSLVVYFGHLIVFT